MAGDELKVKVQALLIAGALYPYSTWTKGESQDIDNNIILKLKQRVWSDNNLHYLTRLTVQYRYTYKHKSLSLYIKIL